MKLFLKNLLKRYIINRTKKGYEKFYETCFDKITCFETPVSTPLAADVEKRWVARFRDLDSSIDASALRVFSHYIDNPDHIFPYETFQSFIMPAINARRFDTFYDDKNNLDVFLKKGTCCQAVLRRIDRIYETENFAVLSDLNLAKVYSIFDSYTELIIKPSYRTSGGKSVAKLTKVKGRWMVNDTELTMSFLDSYNDNFVIQVLLKQSDYMSQFCSTSVNTLRTITYRSITDNKTEIIATILRIGHNGDLTDNISTGGKAVRVDKNGEIASDLFDYYGNITHEINSIDFRKSQYRIPNYSAIVLFAEEIANAFPHHHLLALDIALDRDNCPKLIEANVNGFSLDVPYFAKIDLFRDRADEILEFTKKHRNNIFGTITF